jgi:DNA-binding CsgD family transcriptional regulator
MKHMGTGKRKLKGRPLSLREQEVMALAIRGLSKPQMAQALGLSLHTIATNVRNVYRKLDVHSRTAAVWAVLAGAGNRGAHSLRCPRCGQTWEPADAGSCDAGAAAQGYVLHEALPDIEANPAQTRRAPTRQSQQFKL